MKPFTLSISPPPRAREMFPASDGVGRATVSVARRARGFTLFEILVVLTLLVLIAGIAWPILGSRITAAELPESANQIRDMLYMARASAALEHRRYRIRFAPDEQQPHIEFEPDPILRPGEWEPATSAWTSVPMLLANVQVHDIQPGRPIYLEPLSADDDPQQKEDDQLAQKEEEEANQFDATAAQSAMDNGDEEIDEQRPLIIFGPDGSTDWATLVLAKESLEEPLEETHDQLWVVLDGRTGLAVVREKVTEAQLADEDFFVERDKLELPELDTSNLSFEIGDSAGPGFIGGNSSGGPGRRIGESAGFGDPRAGGQSPNRSSDTIGSDALQGLNPSSDSTNGGDNIAENNTSPDDNTPTSELEDALENSDLTEEERANIRRTLNNRRGGN